MQNIPNETGAQQTKESKTHKRFGKIEVMVAIDTELSQAEFDSVFSDDTLHATKLILQLSNGQEKHAEVIEVFAADWLEPDEI